MESTSVFWIPLFQILEDRGFRVCLVNARHFGGRVRISREDKITGKTLLKIRD
jgi:methyltransferase-like protein